MRVRGPSLELRYARPSDAAVLFELGRDEDVTRFFSWGPYAEEAEALAYVEALPPQRESGERLEFVIARDGAAIGVIGLTEFSARDRRAVIGTWLGRPHWGSGANAEAKAMMLHLGFEVLGLHRVSALASPDNARSLAALERLGFVHEGELVDWHRHGERYRDTVILRLLEEDYRRSPLAEIPCEAAGEVPPAFTLR